MKTRRSTPRYTKNRKTRRHRQLRKLSICSCSPDVGDCPNCKL